MKILKCCSGKWDISRLILTAGGQERLRQRYNFFVPAWGQPITEDWRAHGDGSGSSPRRTEEWGTWALCKVTTSLAVEKQGCIVLLPHLYLPRGERAVSCCHHETGATAMRLRDESPACSLPWCSQCPKDTGEHECVHSHIAQRGLRSIPVSAASSLELSFQAAPTWWVRPGL